MVDALPSTSCLPVTSLSQSLVATWRWAVNTVVSALSSLSELLIVT